MIIDTINSICPTFKRELELNLRAESSGFARAESAMQDYLIKSKDFSHPFTLESSLKTIAKAMAGVSDYEISFGDYEVHTFPREAILAERFSYLGLLELKQSQ